MVLHGFAQTSFSIHTFLGCEPILLNVFAVFRHVGKACNYKKGCTNPPASFLEVRYPMILDILYAYIHLHSQIL